MRPARLNRNYRASKSADVEELKAQHNPITPADLVAILNGSVLLTSPKVADSDSSIVRLTDEMNQCFRLAALNASEFKQQREDTERVRVAVETLVTCLQQIDSAYDRHMVAHRLFGGTLNTSPLNTFALNEGPQGKLPQLEKERASLRNLHDAARAAQALGAPRSFVQTIVPDKWESYARVWISFFQRRLPGRPLAAGYRFVVAMAPIITKDTPTEEAVRSCITRGRPVSARERKKKSQ
jgi:hypothetical protein